MNALLGVTECAELTAPLWRTQNTGNESVAVSQLGTSQLLSFLSAAGLPVNLLSSMPRPD